MRNRTDSTGSIRRLDPIDGEQLDSSWSASHAKQALFQEVTSMPVDTLAPVEAPEPASVPRRRFAFAAAGVAAVAVALVVAQAVWFSATPAYAVRPLENGVIEVTVTPQMRDGDALAAELREYGIDVEIVPIPSSPSMVGAVEIFRADGGDGIPPGLTFGEDGTPDVFNWRIDPAVFNERLRIEVRVAALEGEAYQLANEVFEPGEVLAGLHCALGEPMSAADVAPYLAELGITPIWFEVTPTNDPSITNETEVAGVPDGDILHGFAIDAHTVSFRVRPAGVTLTDYSSYLSDVPCTPDQSAAWR